MGCIIVAMPKLEDARKIGDMLWRKGVKVSLTCTLASEVLYEAQNAKEGIVICSVKLKDMGYMELAGYLPKMVDIILLTHDISMANELDNVVNMTMPFKPSDLVDTVNMLIHQHERILNKQKETLSKRSGDEKAIIDRAKFILMERNDMTEPEAYRYIQKCSMDSGTNMVETAEMVLLMMNNDE